MFLERGRVAFSAGDTFGAAGAGFVRLNLATHPELLIEAVTRMTRAVSRGVAPGRTDHRERALRHADRL